MVPELRLLALAGPSGAGKSTLVRRLVRRGVVELTPSWTTRPARPDEADGVPEHVFVDDEAFAALEAGGFFVGTVDLFGARYGLPPVPPPPPGRIPAVIVRAPVLPGLFAAYPRSVVYQVEAAYRGAGAVLDDRAATAPGRAAGLAAELAAGRRVATRVFRNGATPGDLVAAVEAALATDFEVAGAGGRR